MSQRASHLPTGTVLVTLLILECGRALAAGIPGRIDQIVVTAQKIDPLVGEVTSASEGTVLAEQLENRPILRTGEVLEVVPGLIVTQHSGDGKANQYFLRGFNLDHGTDFATSVEGMPVNMPTHAHGQGYSDINFLIPELVQSIRYKKGTYYAEAGNFSAAGAADISYVRRLDNDFARLEFGADQYSRQVLAGSVELAGGDLLMGFDTTYTNGPWDLNEHIRKANGVAKFTRGSEESGFSLEAMGYDGRWRSTDQIPQRAVDAGLIDRYGFIDGTDGGSSHRYSGSASWWGGVGPGRLRALVYGIDYRLDLISNFTYATNQADVVFNPAYDPGNPDVGGHGDQFEQFDDRTVLGTDVRYAQPLPLLGREGTFTAGLQVRYDDIAPVGLYHTEQRVRWETVRQDDVQQSSYAVYLSQSLQLTPWWRGELGGRFDYYRFDVASNLAANSGFATDSIASPKLTMVFGPWAETEFFLNFGQGFHSNDARGATITVDPADGVTPVPRVTPLVRATGAEVGVSSAVIPTLRLSASLWTLKLDSELVFSGDGGTTEASRASRRTGLELSAYYTPVDWLIVDADLAFTRPRFTDSDPAGDRIPGAIDRVASVGVTVNRETGWYGGARLRYLGPGALIEDNSVRSKPTTLVNFEAGYRFPALRNVSLSLTLLNAFNSRGDDIQYYYESRLPGEGPVPVADVHFHPVEPRMLRGGVTVSF